MSIMLPGSDSPQGSPFPSQRNCILLVEDDFLIRCMLGDELRDAGYRVVEACEATEAISILTTVSPDLVISDVRMPGPLDGLDLLAHVREISPTLPVIIISGHLHPTQAMNEGATRFLAKPYLLGVVVDAIREALEKTT